MEELKNRLAGYGTQVVSLASVVIATIVASVVALIINRPSGEVVKSAAFIQQFKNAALERSTIIDVQEQCNSDGSACDMVPFAEINGEVTQISSTALTDEVNPGDNVWLMRGGEGDSVYYSIFDIDNVSLVIFLLVVLVVAVVAFAGRRGAIALFGVVLSCLAVGLYLVPVVSAGQDMIVPTVAMGIILLAMIMFLTHGVRKSTAVAYLGTVCSLVAVGVTMSLLKNNYSVNGLNDTDVREASFLLENINSAELFSAAVIIGSLGLFNDICVAQASSVRELVQHNRNASASSVAKIAMRIGRDHTASIIYTVTLVFLGAALPSVVVYVNSGIPWSDLLLSGAFSLELIRTSICIIALCASVPLTTLAAVALEHTGDEDVDEEDAEIVHAH